MNEYTALFLLLVGIATLTQLWLANRHRRHVARHRAAVPAAFANDIALKDHQKAADYTIAKTRFGMGETVYEAALLLLWTIGGGLQLLDSFIGGFELNPVLSGVIVMLGVMLISSLLDLPFSLYHTFRLEERFGFNHTSSGTFMSDLFKQALLSIVIGAPLLALVLWLMEISGPYWWLYVWAVWMGFSLLMMWVYPAFIAPLFNKFQALEDDSLRIRIEQLLQRCGFSSQGILVMDGSRRSGHGNAYFTGLGQNKRIVFFDTLLKSLSPDEVEAVLAHELGHFKRKHIHKRMASLFLMSLAGLALLGWLIEQPAFFHSLGVEQASNHAGLVLFMFLSPLAGLFLSPVMSALSRKHEFEADDYAAEQTRADDLVQALVKLYRENASTLTPDPLYSAFHDSHPPAPVRIAHLNKATV